MRRSSGFPRLGQLAVCHVFYVAAPAVTGLQLSRIGIPPRSFPLFFLFRFLFHFPVQAQSTRRCWLPGKTGGQP